MFDEYVSSDLSMKMANLLEYIDCDIAGPEYASKEKNINFPAFVAGYLQEIIQKKEFENILKKISEKIKHLSFLVHLMCRYENFDKVYSEYKSVQGDLAIGNIGWEDEQYFREWEMLQVNKISEVCQNIEEEDMKVLSDSEDDEMQSFYGNDILEDEEDNSDPIHIGILKKERKSRRSKKHILKKNEGLTKHQFRLLKYRCTDCDDVELKLASRKAFRRHLFTVHDQRLCEDCGKVFDQFENLWQHGSQSHTCSGVAKFICEICKIRYKTEGLYEAHKEKVHGVLRSISNDVRKKQVCEECGISVFDLNEHMKKVHSSVKNYLCQFCDKRYKSQSDLSGHIKHQHNTISNCPHCDKKVKYLDSHVQKMKCYLPSNQRPRFEMPCKECGKIFTRKSYLRAHLSRVHGELKECPSCDFKTKYSQNLKMHIRTVHDKKPVKEKCPHCNKICVSLEWHISVYHKVET